MIILYKTTTYKNINEKTYRKIINKHTIHKLLSGTEFEDFEIHGYYERHILDSNGELQTILIMRIIVSGRTHAVVPSFMLPYLRYHYEDVISIMVHHQIPVYFPFSEYSLTHLRHLTGSLVSFDYASVAEALAHKISLFFIPHITAVSPDFP